VLPADRAAMLAAVRRGQDEVTMTARLGNRPVIVLHGRADGLIPVNHASRAYYAVNCRDRGVRDELRYYELEHGQHFDGSLALPGFAARFVPMQGWTVRCLELLWARLRDGAPLPPSQVIRSQPRGTAPLAASHLGALAARPGAEAAIRYSDGVLSIPE
jgi:hydroxybutyrate-dimer hydrolase